MCGSLRVGRQLGQNLRSFGDAPPLRFRALADREARRRPSITLSDVRGGDADSALAQLPLRHLLGEDWRLWRQKASAPKCDLHFLVRARKWSNFSGDSVLCGAASADASALPRRCDACASADEASPNFQGAARAFGEFRSPRAAVGPWWRGIRAEHLVHQGLPHAAFTPAHATAHIGRHVGPHHPC